MDTQEIEKLLEDNERSLIEIYFDLQLQFEEKYGPNTVVIIEVGSFFEVYGVDNETQKIGKPKEVAEILNLQLTRKNKTILHNTIKNPLLAGFPVATFDRYIQRLIQENKYTIVVVRQAGVPPHITRHVERIISPGVNFDYSLDHDNNFIASLLVDETHGLYSVGYSAIDVTTGKTYAQEIHSTKEDPSFALDEVFRLIRAYRTSEILFTVASSSVDEYKVRQYLELFETDVKINTKRLKVSYQNELLKRTYIIKSFLSPIEFLDLEKKPLTSEALTILLDFIIDHDYQIIQKLEKPTILSSENYLYLGNNPLEQLSIIARDPNELTIASYIDYTVTSIGRRLLRERLLNPITNPTEIEQRYNLSDILGPVHLTIDQELQGVYDLERIIRRIQLGRLHPFEINFLYDSLKSADRIVELIVNLKNHVVVENFINEKSNLQNCLVFLEKTFHFEQTGRVALQAIDTNIFQAGFHAGLDELMQQKQALEEKLELIRNKILEVLETETGKKESDFVEIRQLEKEGHHISLTRSRFALIEEKLRTTFVSLDGVVYAFSDFSFKTQTTNIKITAPIMDRLSEEIVVLQGKIVATTKELFLAELHNMEEKFLDLFLNTTTFLSKVDVAVSNVKASIKLNLIRPEIIQIPADEHFLEIQDLRHLLVEAREENGIYVPNDVFLGNKKHTQAESLFTTMTPENIRGVLLYGINSSGKSSFMKSIGVALVLAQSGFYIPAKSMRFSIFSEIFTRILARDNFEKGLSSFGVEMMELKNIFNRCTKRSLILGDEISHGTETLSALAIVSATIEHLVDKGAFFLFTTHLHQLCNLDRIQKIKEVVSVHLEVSYDSVQDKLIFERKLQPGSGSSIYGLEFAESLHIDKEFMKRAQTIRKELAKDYQELELLTKKQKSKYHKELYLSTCAICKNMVEDTHHIAPQEIADTQGNIGHFHKNHKYNLLPLCKDCHHKVHEGKLIIRGFVMTSNGLEIDFEEK